MQLKIKEFFIYEYQTYSYKLYSYNCVIWLLPYVGRKSYAESAW